jgi:hypothetical protein
MPIYRNRMPMAADTPLWHYTSLHAVTSMLRDRPIRLTRVDTFADPFEGSIPKSQCEGQLPIFSSADASDWMAMGVAVHHPGMPQHGASQPRTRHRARWTECTQRRKAQKRSTHAICWRWGHESEAMWRLYCKDRKRGQGLALRTRFGKLEASVSQRARDLALFGSRSRLESQASHRTGRLASRKAEDSAAGDVVRLVDFL